MLLALKASWQACVQQRRFNMIISENCNIIKFLTFPSCVEISNDPVLLEQRVMKNFPSTNCYITNFSKLINFRLARKCQSARNAKKKSTLVSLHCQFKNLIEILAEKVTSLGKDWHRPCLRCEKCNKVGFPKNRVHHEKF